MEGIKRRLLINTILCFGFALCIGLFADTQKTQTTNEACQDEKLGALELPAIKSEQPEQVVEHLGYTVSFNKDWRIPNWVAYELTAQEVSGEEFRAKHFAEDPMIVDSPSPNEYSNSGYDRGHMAPAGDMKWDKQAMNESFYTSNICPQNQNLNKGDWKDLEEHIRSMATKFDHIYIVCGPIVSMQPNTIGTGNKIVVPDAFFKAVLRKTDDTWTAIGFMMPNQAGHKGLHSYAMSIEELEIITDIDFFYNLPDDIEEKIESECLLGYWGL